LVLAFLFGAAAFAAFAHAAPVVYGGSSEDGGKVFFTAGAKLVPGDTDNHTDVYERFYDSQPGIEAYVTRELSTGPTGGNDAYDATFDGVSADGTKVFFSTAESLVAADRDHSTDIYMRNTVTGETALVSAGAESCSPTCGNGSSPATYIGSTLSGSRVFFTTNEQLAEGDTDEAADVYMRNLETTPATTVLVSRPDPACTACTAASPVTVPVYEGKPAISADGKRVVFESADKLAEGDESPETDIYERDLTTGTTTLVSAAMAGSCPAPLTASECAPIYRGLSGDGSHVFFQTRARLSGEDHDDFQDVYDWSAATETSSLISISGEAEQGNGEHNAFWVGTSEDGDKVFFTTAEELSSEDHDAAVDLYERVGGETKLVSPGNGAADIEFEYVSPDGSTVIFSTSEALGGGDTGSESDIYEETGGRLDLVSPGSAEFEAGFAGASKDGTHVFYTTAQPISGADTDEQLDIYEWTAGVPPELVSTGEREGSPGQLGGNGPYAPHLSGLSADGNHAFFITEERLTEADDSPGLDIYEHSGSNTFLVSVGNSGELALGPLPPGVTGTDPASPADSTEPAILGEAEAGTSIKVYATSDCSGVPAGIGTAAGVGSPDEGHFSVPVSVAVGSTTTFRTTATNGTGDTSACSASSVTYRQENPSSPGGGTGGEGAGSGGAGSGGSGGGGSNGSTGGSNGSSGGGSGGGTRGGVAYVPPQVRITFGPASKTRLSRPIFRFADGTEQPGTTFFCKIDRHAWTGCGSPTRLKALKPGSHVFAVKGRSAAGQWGSAAVSRRFKVVKR
jgi:Tol biopolymer transport system component